MLFDTCVILLHLDTILHLNATTQHDTGHNETGDKCSVLLLALPDLPEHKECSYSFQYFPQKPP